MSSATTNCIFLLTILLICSFRSVSTSCTFSQKTCYASGYYQSWCCDQDQTCGSYYLSCNNPSSLSPGVVAVIVVGSVFFFIICLVCCIHSQQRQQQQEQQRMRAAYANATNRAPSHPYQQQAARGPVRFVQVRPVYTLGNTQAPQPYPSMYEAPPPSYETATSHVPKTHQVSPVTAIVHQSN